VHINEIHIRNFRNFGDLKINVGTLSILVGANNVGKTNFMQALQKVFAPVSVRSVKVERIDFRDASQPIVITVTFTDLTERDKEIFYDQRGLINAEKNTLTLCFKSHWDAFEQDVVNESYFLRDDKPFQEQQVAEVSFQHKQHIPLLLNAANRLVFDELNLSKNQNFGRTMKTFAGDYLKPFLALKQHITESAVRIETEVKTIEGCPPELCADLLSSVKQLTDLIEHGVPADLTEVAAQGLLASATEVREKISENIGGVQTQIDTLLVGHNEEKRTIIIRLLNDLSSRTEALIKRIGLQLELYRLSGNLLGIPAFQSAQVSRSERKIPKIIGFRIPQTRRSKVS
jgi:hypothetical protein